MCGEWIIWEEEKTELGTAAHPSGRLLVRGPRLRVRSGHSSNSSSYLMGVESRSYQAFLQRSMMG